MPIVEKQRLASRGRKPPSSGDGERELVLERDLEPEAALREARRHALQERARTLRRRLSLERDVVDEERAAARCVRQDAERRRVGHEPDLADRAHPVDRLKLVERVHRLHPDRQPDPARQPALEPFERARLRAHRPVVAAPEEPDEAELGLACPPHDILRRGRGRVCQRAWLRSNSSSQRTSSDLQLVARAAVGLQRVDVAPVVGELPLELGHVFLTACDLGLDPLELVRALHAVAPPAPGLLLRLLRASAPSAASDARAFAARSSRRRMYSAQPPS